MPVASKACAELMKCGCKSENGCGTKDVGVKKLTGHELNSVLAIAQNKAKLIIEISDKFKLKQLSLLVFFINHICSSAIVVCLLCL